MHRFDPNENPFVEDLLRLLGPRRRGFPYRWHPSDPVKGRFSPSQFRALARIFLSRLYGVDQGGYLKNTYVWHDGPVRCSVRVVLDHEDGYLRQMLGSMRREQMSGLVPEDTRVVLVHVGLDGVTELFSGRRDVLVRSLIELFGDKDPYGEVDREPHRWPFGAWMHDVMDSIVDPEGRVPPLDGVEARDAYWGDISYDDDDAWPRHRNEPPGAVANDGRGRHGGSGDGGDGEGPRGPDDRDGPGPGRGGVMEVLGHPVLFSADPQLLADILENL